jgi:hypothetical protein
MKGDPEVELSAGFEECWKPQTIDGGDLRELTLYRVAAFTKEWFSESHDGSVGKFGRTVSARRVSKAVEEMLKENPEIITVQKLT